MGSLDLHRCHCKEQGHHRAFTESSAPMTSVVWWPCCEYRHRSCEPVTVHCRKLRRNFCAPFNKKEPLLATMEEVFFAYLWIFLRPNNVQKPTGKTVQKVIYIHGGFSTSLWTFSGGYPRLRDSRICLHFRLQAGMNAMKEGLDFYWIIGKVGIQPANIPIRMYVYICTYVYIIYIYIYNMHILCIYI